jgi:peptidoglycan/xylan/chitin deacetylase (PgdA/CDA1 family)
VTQSGYLEVIVWGGRLIMRRLLSCGAVVATALALGVPVLAAAPARAATPTTTVVLSFDGTLVTGATVAAPLLDARGMRGTFYVNSNLVGSDDAHLGWGDLTALEADGHEIGGHALDMIDLTTLPVDQMHAEVCQDRANLVNHGLAISDFAYPSGMGYETPAVHDTVSACGYNSARRAWGLYSSNPNCTTTGCGYSPAGPIPPDDAYKIPTADIVQSTTTLSDLEAIVTRAEAAGGGLVPIIFQEICDGCDTYSTTAATLTSFLDFLQADSNVVVKTMHDVIGGTQQPLDTTAPVSTIACNSAACSTDWYAGLVDVSLAATDAQSGVAGIFYTTDGSDPTNASTRYVSPFSVSMTKTVKYRAYDIAGNAEAVHSTVIKADNAAPATTVACNATPCSNGWYTSSVDLTLAASDSGGSGLAAIHYTTDGSLPTASSPTYSTPLSIGATTTVKFRAYDVAGNAEPTHSQLVDIDTTEPATDIACNATACSDGWYHGPVRVSFAPSDSGSGVAAVHYTTDGSLPTAASPTYGAPFTRSTTTTIRFRAFDVAGNAEPTQTQVVEVDTVAPTAGITCDNAVCATARWYRGPVQIALNAADTGGSGLAAVHYTTDGSTPTTSSPSYKGPFAVSATKTVKFRAWDGAGNVEVTQSQLVDIDTVAPTSAISCNSKACSASGWYRGSVKVALTGADAGSGVSAIHYTTDGSTPTAASKVYSAPLTLRATRNVKMIVTDNAGNNGAVRSTLVRVDATRPTIKITSPKNHQWVKGRVKVSALAADAQSGISKVRFYVDGKLVATDTRAGYGFVWNTARLSRKSHKLAARAIDRAGNVSGVSSITVVVR